MSNKQEALGRIRSGTLVKQFFVPEKTMVKISDDMYCQFYNPFDRTVIVSVKIAKRNSTKKRKG